MPYYAPHVTVNAKITVSRKEVLNFASKILYKILEPTQPNEKKTTQG